MNKEKFKEMRSNICIKMPNFLVSLKTPIFSTSPTFYTFIFGLIRKPFFSPLKWDQTLIFQNPINSLILQVLTPPLWPLPHLPNLQLRTCCCTQVLLRHASRPLHHCCAMIRQNLNCLFRIHFLKTMTNNWFPRPHPDCCSFPCIGSRMSKRWAWSKDLNFLVMKLGLKWDQIEIKDLTFCVSELPF